MSYTLEASERAYRIVVGLIVIVVGLFMFISLNLWYGLAVMALGFIPLSSGLLGACPTIPLMQ
jgi:Inner membrane protein YgaP-like, transmembrane domain